MDWLLSLTSFMLFLSSLFEEFMQSRKTGAFVSSQSAITRAYCGSFTILFIITNHNKHGIRRTLTRTLITVPTMHKTEQINKNNICKELVRHWWIKSLSWFYQRKSAFMSQKMDWNLNTGLGYVVRHGFFHHQMKYSPVRQSFRRTNYSSSKKPLFSNSPGKMVFMATDFPGDNISNSNLFKRVCVVRTDGSR